MNNLFVAKINVVNPYSFECFGGQNTCISSYNSYMTIVYKKNNKYYDLLNKEVNLHPKDYIFGVKRYEIEELTPIYTAIKKSLIKKR